MLHSGICRITLPLALLLFVCAQPDLNTTSGQAAKQQKIARDRDQANHRLQPTQGVPITERPAADELFEAGKKLAAKWDENSLRAALDKLSEARSLWHSQNSNTGEVKALIATAEILINLSEYQNAIKALNEGLKLNPAPSDRVKLLNGLSSAYLYLGNEKQARAPGERANQL